MNSLMMALQTIALLCGPRVQTTSNGVSSGARVDAKECQVQLIRCVQVKVDAQTVAKDYEKPLAQCVQEVK